MTVFQSTTPCSEQRLIRTTVVFNVMKWYKRANFSPPVSCVPAVPKILYRLAIFDQFSRFLRLFLIVLKQSFLPCLLLVCRMCFKKNHHIARSVGTDTSLKHVCFAVGSGLKVGMYIPNCWRASLCAGLNNVCDNLFFSLDRRFLSWTVARQNEHNDWSTWSMVSSTRCLDGGCKRQ